MWNANNIVQDSNSGSGVHFLWRYPLHLECPPLSRCLCLCLSLSLSLSLYVYIYIYIYIYISKKLSLRIDLKGTSPTEYIRGLLNTFPDFFRMGTLYTHETLVPFEVISPGCNALVVPFQQLLEGTMEVLLCERVNDLRHSLFHLLNSLITTASELRI